MPKVPLCRVPEQRAGHRGVLTLLACSPSLPVPVGQRPGQAGRFLGAAHGGHHHRRACTFLGDWRGENHGVCSFLGPRCGGVRHAVRLPRSWVRRGVSFAGRSGGGLGGPRNQAGTGPYSTRTRGNGACPTGVRVCALDTCSLRSHVKPGAQRAELFARGQSPEEPAVDRTTGDGPGSARW